MPTIDYIIEGRCFRSNNYYYTLHHITASPLTLYNHNMPSHAIASSQPLPASRQKADILGTSNNCNQVLEDLHTWRWIEYAQRLNIKKQSEWHRSRSSRNVKRSFFRDLLDVVIQSIFISFDAFQGVNLFPQEKAVCWTPSIHNFTNFNM